MNKQYGTVQDLVNILKGDYCESTYYTIFSVVTDEDWNELELLVEDLQSKRGELYDDLSDVEFCDEGVSTEEYNRTINFGVQY